MESRRLVITGASRGIGMATSRILAERGHRPVRIARTAPPAFPGEFETVGPADRAATVEAAKAVLARGAVDGLVNNVGLVRPAMLGSVDLDDLHAVFDLNVRVAVQLAQEPVPGMVERGWGGGWSTCRRW